MILLDTNVIIALVRQTSWMVRHRYKDALGAREAIGVSSIVLFEFHYGIARSARREQNAAQLRHFLSGPVSLLPFEPEDALAAGEVRAALRAAGTPIGPYDVLIAGQAVRRGATLVTANMRELARVPGLQVADWTT